MEKTKVIVYVSYFLLVIFDMIIVSDARCLLFDFLIGQRNRKNAKQIHSEQTIKNRVTMGYIQPMLTKHQKVYKKYHMLYLMVLYSLIPQYVSIIFFQLFAPQVVKYILCVFFVARFLLAIFYRLELGPQRISIYAKKK